MSHWQSTALEEWNELRSKAASDVWPIDPTLSVERCARRVGLEWFDTRAADTITEFLQYDGAELLRLPSFGRVKIQRLIEIVKLNLATPDEFSGATAQEAMAHVPMTERLAEWQIPAELPCDLIWLPTRIRNFCRENDVHRVVDLVAIWELMGWEGLMEQKNLGRRSVGEIAKFCEALHLGDRVAASAWLPINPDHDGLSLTMGLVRLVGELEFHQRDMLEKRLVDGLTLEQSAEDFGITRERVRQLEALLSRRVELLLNWFPEVKETMLANWLVGNDWSAPLQNVPNEEDRRFVCAVIEAQFRDLPQAVARSLEQQAMLDEWHDLLRVHPDLLIEGVDLDAYMQANVPENLRDELCHSLTGRGRIRLDHSTGRVVHTDPHLKDVVRAVLDREDDPIPLTWLLELVRLTPSHSNVERDQIARYKAQWKSDDPSFPREKIIWDE